MLSHYADRLNAAILEKGTPTCVGIDPRWDRLPAALTPTVNGEGLPDREQAVEAIASFCRGIINVVAPLVPAVKINIAYFEPYLWSGLQAYCRLVAEARARGLVVIGDIKRADVGHSSEMYARAHLGGDSVAKAEDSMLADAVTLNPYFGVDGVLPFIESADQTGRGVYVLVQTSNPSVSQTQGQLLMGGGTFVEHVARLVDEWANANGRVGECGYSSVGAVVAPHDLATTQRLRTLMPHSLFLVPGFGAQGRGADDVAACFQRDGSGAVVTASRSVIYAFQDDRHRAPGDDSWEKCVERGCREFVRQVASAIK